MLLASTQVIYEALRDGEIAKAALDVTETEPLPEGHPLFTIDDERLILTPHIGTACLATRGFVFRQGFVFALSQPSSHVLLL